MIVGREMHLLIWLLSVLMITMTSSNNAIAYLLYESADDCDSALKKIMISGNCTLHSNCTFGSIYSAQTGKGTVCSLTTFGNLNEVSGQDYSYMVFYFDSAAHANASFTRIAYDGRADMSADDEFQMHDYNAGHRVSVPEVAGLINISVKQ
eukprot:61839_1